MTSTPLESADGTVPPFGDLRGRVALVTGTGSADGIGFAAARLLHQMGAAVELVATTARVQERAAQLGERASAHVADLTDGDAAAQVVDDIVGRHGRLDVVVNNAGMASLGAGTDAAAPLRHLSIAEWNASLARNLTTAFLVCRAAVPIMQTAQWGRIVNVASTTGTVGAFVDASAYAAAKAGMVGMTRALALEVAAFGITVNAVAPGWIDTPSVSDAERRAGRPRHSAAAVRRMRWPRPLRSWPVPQRRTSPASCWSSMAATPSPRITPDTDRRGTFAAIGIPGNRSPRTDVQSVRSPRKRQPHR